MIKKWLLDSVARQLPDDYDMATHFTPHYQPWDQRLCFAPDGDLFKAITDGRASVVTDRIERFTADGLLLASGATLEADIIITATGITMQMLGGMTIEVDGRPVDLGQTVAYKSVMLGGVPNLAFTFGYTNASWTLKSDIAAHYVCRMLNYMDEHGYSICTPVEPDLPMVRKPFLNLTAGYVERANALYPKQGSRAPWQVRHNYPLDLLMLRYGRLDNQIEFSGRQTAGQAARKVAV
jgi:cation diffusion facilitator CzcD-associated flavoprotein CzcO